ncbi:MAG: hypothetical protein HZB29_08250 [Nitrospinae bacterium]|nr:hypothetical protein [Nitrospinota bacterium]
MAEKGRVILILGDVISGRVFIECGIIQRLAAAYKGALTVLVAPVEVHSPASLAQRFPGIEFLPLKDVYETAVPGAAGKMAQLADNLSDRWFGFYPLALRFNLRHKYNLDRLERGHPNYFWDLDRTGPLPKWDFIYNAMRRWYFSGLRFVHPGITEFLKRARARGIIYSNPQLPLTHAFSLAAMRSGVPLVGYVASWDHPVGKGLIAPFYDVYLVQNENMKNALLDLHGIDPARIKVTGWPQLDKYHAPRSIAQYKAKLASWGLDPEQPCVLMAGNSAVNGPTEPAIFEKVINARDASGAEWSAVVRPHPKDSAWRERYAALAGRRGVYLQGGACAEMDELALLLKHVACVVCTAGTVLLDALVNGRPVAGIMYDDGPQAPEGRAMSNYSMIHYMEIMREGAFYKAGNLDAIMNGIVRSMENPGELAANRERVARSVTGAADGGAVGRIIGGVTSVIPADLADGV